MSDPLVRAPCPVCGTSFWIDPQGTVLWNHTSQVSGFPCPGAGVTLSAVPVSGLPSPSYSYSYSFTPPKHYPWTAHFAPTASRSRDTLPMPDSTERLVKAPSPKSDRGKIGQAPCGHVGEHLSSSYVRCLEGCEGTPDHAAVRAERARRNGSTCPHLSTITHAGTTSCAACGKILRR